MYVYYSYLGRLVYNNGAYSGSGWVEPSDLGVRYAATAGSVSLRAYDYTGTFYAPVGLKGLGGEAYDGGTCSSDGEMIQMVVTSSGKKNTFACSCRLKEYIWPGQLHYICYA